MGKDFLQFFRSRVKREHKFAFVVTFIITLLVHMYKFANTIPNDDALYNFYSTQNVLGSGRWALSLACGFSSYYDLPWVIGLISCLFIALTVVVIVWIFEIKNPVLIGLIGSLIAVSPATTETFFFLYTADGYMIAMFLAALAVCCSRLDEKRPSRWIISGICICVCCAIYQAYVSFALVLAVSYFMLHLLRNSHGKKECLLWVLSQAIVYIVSLAAYFVIWKLCLSVSGTTANDYQGIADVGKVSVGLLKNGTIGSLAVISRFFLQWNVLENGFTLYSVLSLIFLVLLGIVLTVSVIKSKIWKRKWAAVLLVLCVAVMIPFACIWNFTSDSVDYRPMMLQSLTLLFVLMALLYEEWTGPVSKNVAAGLLAVIIFNNAITANICYFYMNLAYERTYADSVEMMMVIHDFQDEYEFEKLAVVGQRSNDMAWAASDPVTGKIAPAGKCFLLTNLLESNLLMNNVQVITFLKAVHGLELESVNDLTVFELAAMPEVKQMGCWPAEDSVRVVGDTLVIKFCEAEEDMECFQ